jgi:hypothetical protein
MASVGYARVSSTAVSPSRTLEQIVAALHQANCVGRTRRVFISALSRIMHSLHTKRSVGTCRG